MSMKDRLAARTKGLGQGVAAGVAPLDGDAVPSKFPRTGPGTMLHVQHLMGETEAETQRLREQLKDFEGSSPAKALDPNTIGISKFANRHEDEFKSKEFLSLREEIRKAGKNVQPIKVRRAKARGKVVYEVIFGHRRLRACHDLEIPVWAIVEEATDEELFVLMDRENRERKNPSAFEQGDSYRRALEHNLFPSLRALAAKLDVDVGNASKAYAIATLPKEVLDAFPSPTQIQYRWSKPLSDALQRDPEAVVSSAKQVKEQGRALTAVQVFQLLTGATKSSPTTLEVRLADGAKPAAVITRDASGAVTVKIPPGTVTDEQLAGLQKTMREFLRG